MKYTAMPDSRDTNLPAVQESHQSGGPLEMIEAVAPSGWRLKLAKAAAQLIAGTEKGAAAYGEIRDRLDTIEGRSTVSKALAKAVAQQAVNDPDLLERAKARYLGDIAQKQINLEAVIVGAGRQLPALPAPEMGAQDAASSQGGEASEVPTLENAPLDADWAATFTGLAENATSDELRERLSRVLAGEIVSPGAYTRATIRLISELERADLEAMRSVLPYLAGSRLFRTQEKPPLPERPTLDLLVEAGLLVEFNELLRTTCDPVEDDETNVLIGGSEWALAVNLKQGRSFDIPIVMLTRAGCAVADLLGRPDEREVLRRVASEIPTDIYHRIFLGRKSGINEIVALEQILPAVPINYLRPHGGVSPFVTPQITP